MPVLEDAMTAKGWSDEKLAEEVNISRVHASRLRRRKCLPSRELAKKLAEVTDIPAERFIFEERDRAGA